jgi:hypothetical protein
MDTDARSVDHTSQGTRYSLRSRETGRGRVKRPSATQREIEKALSGSNSGANDGGVATRLLGTLLTWMNDHESDVFLVATSNDISKLPPEFTRAERFDAVFFLDFPGPAQKAAIWDMYLTAYQLSASTQALPDDSDWTGAEIKSCCRLAALLDVPIAEAATNIVPISSTNGETIARLRAWAEHRCLSAETPGLYRSSSVPATKAARKINRPRDIENN